MTVMMGIPVLGSNVLPTIKGSVGVCGWATIRNVLKREHRISGKKEFNRRRTFCATWIDKIYLPVLVVAVMMILSELVSIVEADFELEGTADLPEGIHRLRQRFEKSLVSLSRCPDPR